MNRMKAAKAIVEIFLEEGIDHIFQLPGSQILEILDCLHGTPIRNVMTRHEQGAAFMADGYARAKRAASVCMSTVGPGAVNLISGIAASFRSSVPVLAITGMHETNILERDSFHEIDQTSMFKPVTKWSYQVGQAEKIPEILRKAFRIALTERKGPVHLAIPSDLASREVEFKPIPPSKSRVSHRITCDKNLIDQILELVDEAKFPVILAGGDILWCRALPELKEFAQVFHIPVVTSWDHMDSFPSTHPMGLGVMGAGRSEAANKALSRADLILALGARFDYQSTRHDHNFIPEKAKIVQVCLDFKEVGQIYLVDVGIVADVKYVLSELLMRGKKGKADGDRFAEIQEIKQAWLKRRNSEVDLSAFPIQPQAIVMRLREVLPEDAIIVVDGGNFAKYIRRYFDTYEADTFHYTDDFGSVGSSFPMSLGVKLAEPRREVFCLTGDGGFLLNIQELETAVRERILVRVVVFNDFGYGNVRSYQKQKYGERYLCDVKNPDFGKLADLFGAHGEQVNNPTMLKNAFLNAMKTDRPTVIDVLMDPKALRTPDFL